jgi:hypothetical protein
MKRAGWKYRQRALPLISAVALFGASSFAEENASKTVDYPTFLELNSTNVSLIRTGEIICEYDCTKTSRPDVRARSLANYEERKRSISADPNTSEAQKADEIRQVESLIHIAKSGGLPGLDEKYAAKRSIVFDTTAGMYKQEQEPADPSAFVRNREDMIRLGRQTIAHYEIRTTLIVAGSSIFQYKPDFHALSIGRSTGAIDFIPMLGRFDAKRFGAGYTLVRSNVSEVDGHQVVVYELADQQNRALRLYTDPQLAYLLRRIVFINGGVITREINAKDYQAFDGIEFPTYYEDVTYNNDESRSVATSETWRIVKAAFNNPIDPAVFNFPLTSGITITDFRLDKTYTLQVESNQIYSLLDLIGK